MNILLSSIICLSLLVVNVHSIISYYGQFEQDKYVNKNFFHNKRKGVFIDIGASNGIINSNTYFFEKNLAWTGICIEPMEVEYKALIKNRKCICINGCISDVAGPAKFFYITTQIGSGIGLSGLIDKYDPIHFQNLQNLAHKYSWNTKTVNVYCYTLGSILKKYNLQHIDYLSIDVEGAELDVLRTVDLNKYDIDIIDVENNNPANTSIQKFLAQYNYKFIARVGVDDIYRKAKYIQSKNVSKDS